MKQKIWGYMIKLSSNMWGDKGGTSRFCGFEEELSTDYAVWREIIDFLPSQGINLLLIDIGDGIQYESHPEVSVKGAWSKEKMKKELDYIRSLGITPIPKLNFSAGHDAWLKDYQRMVSTPTYYQVCEDLIKEVAELFDYPEYFHLGMDEEHGNQPTNAFVCVRQGDLWWHDAYFFFNVCEKLGMRPWVWADMCWNNKEEYLTKMPKSVLQSNWYYSAIRRNPDGSYEQLGFQAYQWLEEKGFDQVPTSCSTWRVWYNSLETMELSKKHIAPERLLGHMTAAWQFTRPYARYMLMNDAYVFGKARKEIYPDW